MSGGFNPVNLASQVALGIATGGTSIVAQLALQVATQIGAQVIQQLGQQMGLPPALIDAAQGAMYTAAGNPAQGAAEFGSAAQNATDMIGAFGDSIGASPAEIGEANSVADQLNSIMMDGARDAAERLTGGSLRGGKGGGSLLMRIAIALGSLMDQKMDQMDKLTTQIGGLGTIDSKNQAQMGELTGKLQGLSQELNMLSNALTNSIKTIGEAGTTLARKS